LAICLRHWVLTVMPTRPALGIQNGAIEHAIAYLGTGALFGLPNESGKAAYLPHRGFSRLPQYSNQHN